VKEYRCNDDSCIGAQKYTDKKSNPEHVLALSAWQVGIRVLVVNVNICHFVAFFITKL